MEMQASLRITVLGGQEQIGLNCSVIETKNDAVVVDLGNNFEDGEFGVGYYIPNIDFLMARREKIRGVLITHGHYDHRAAVPYLIDKLGYPPIYGSPFTLGLIRQHLKKVGKEQAARLIPLQPRQELSLGQMRIKAVHLTHSILGTYGYFIRTLGGNVFHTGDFKFDDTPFKELPPDYASLQQAQKEGVMVLMMDSTRANKEGHSQSETSITHNLENLIRNARGRIVVSTFAQMISRINQIALLGRKYRREIFIKGSTLEKTVQLAREMGILENTLIMRDAKEMKRFADNQILLFATGSQGEEKAALNKMLEAKEGTAKIKATDTIILSSSTIPSNVVSIQKLVDSFADRGCEVFTDDIIDIHAGGHGHQEEIKKMITLLRPKFIFPVEGYISFRQQLGRVAGQIGYRKNQIILAKNNQPVLVGRGGFSKQGGAVKKPSVVIGDRVIENGEELVSQRKLMAKRGLVTILINRRKRRLKIVSFGVPGNIIEMIKQDLPGQKIAAMGNREIRKKAQALLRLKFEDELVPAIQVENL